MAAIRFFAVLYFVAFTALNYEFVDGDDCVEKPAIHLDGKISGYGSHPYKSGAAIFWDTASKLTFIDDGMKYANGVITVPYTGKYYVYCQMYYRKPHKEESRHQIWVNHKPIAEAGGGGKEYEGSHYTGMVVKLQTGDKLTCRLRWDSNLWDGTFHSYFGAYML